MELTRLQTSTTEQLRGLEFDLELAKAGLMDSDRALQSEEAKNDGLAKQLQTVSAEAWIFLDIQLKCCNVEARNA